MSDTVIGADAIAHDVEVHLREGDRLHRVSLRHGRTVSEPASW